MTSIKKGWFLLGEIVFLLGVALMGWGIANLQLYQTFADEPYLSPFPHPRIELSCDEMGSRIINKLVKAIGFAYFAGNALFNFSSFWGCNRIFYIALQY